VAAGSLGNVVRHFLFFAVSACLSSASSVVAVADDYQGASGYGTSQPNYQFDVAHDGYGGVGRAMDSAEPPSYVVVEAEAGTTTEVEGETVVVVQEPEPVAATMQAPPPPRVAPSDEQVQDCPTGVWVHGYWDYRDGQYAWVDGHCVEVRVNYVFVHPRWDFYWDIWWFIPGYYRPCDAYVGFGYYRPWHWFPPHPRPYYRSGRAVPVTRGAPMRTTVARPAPAPRVPSVTRVPKHPTTVIHTTPSGATQPISFGRAGTGPVISDRGPRSRQGVGIVTEPRFNPRPAPDVRGRRPSGGSRGFSGGRSRGGPSSGTSRGRTGGRTRPAPSTGRSGRGSSSGGRGSGFEGRRSK